MYCRMSTQNALVNRGKYSLIHICGRREKWRGYKPEQLFVSCVMYKICMKSCPPGMHPFLFSVFCFIPACVSDQHV